MTVSRICFALVVTADLVARAALARRLRSDYDKYEKVIKTSGANVD
jgi:hypothetical protein